jgi:hypothetical protein
MGIERTTVADFIAKGATPDEWKMVLVEEGPWTGAIENHLRRVQEREGETANPEESQIRKYAMIATGSYTAATCND